MSPPARRLTVAEQKKIDAAYVAMLEAKLALAEAKAREATTVSFTVATGTSKKNGKAYSGVKVSGPAWGYVSAGVFRAIVENHEQAKAALAKLS